MTIKAWEVSLWRTHPNSWCKAYCLDSAHSSEPAQSLDAITQSAQGHFLYVLHILHIDQDTIRHYYHTIFWLDCFIGQTLTLQHFCPINFSIYAFTSEVILPVFIICILKVFSSLGNRWIIHLKKFAVNSNIYMTSKLMIKI